MQDANLVINAGSSSIKFAVFVGAGDASEPEAVFKGQMEGIGSDPAFAVKDGTGNPVDERDEWPRGSPLNHVGAIRYILGWLKECAGHLDILAAGHRVVHGGIAYVAPVRITAEVIGQLRKLVPLAPLHQPHNIAAIEALAEVDPDLPQVACFDTAFHSTQPKVARLFAIPRELIDSGIRRYGFHGLSYEYIARQVALHAPEARRVVAAHLGSGASMCAMRDGHSVESTMGFTAVDGLPMGTRCGALDPGVVLFLIQDRGYDAKAIETLLYKQSGLLGVSGVSNDMRDLMASRERHAADAIDLFVYQITRYVGSLAAALGGIDALVFTGGIGEHSPAIRQRVCEQSAWLGLTLDPEANASRGPRISAAGSTVSAWAIPTDEERMIAIHTRAVLGATA
ncbi:MAG: acetate/propionate family kinase [Defluviicoccus sp.]|nr:acetate/propionate family kinase [Defluviicoccus sp.]MDG4608320.1 acetate/propionate family kinase [Defluviicoccus sp.]